MRRLLKTSGLLTVLSAAALNLAAAPLEIMVSIPPQKHLVESIGAGRVHVKVLMPAGRSPETWEPGVRQLRELSHAQLFFQEGVPFERKVIRALRESGNLAKIVELRGEREPQRDHDHAAHSGDDDPHFWTSPDLLAIRAKRVRDALIAADSVGHEFYQSAYQAYLDSLANLDRSVRAALARRNSDYFLVTHPAWGYFARHYGLHQLAVEKEGHEPQAKAMAGLVNQVRKHKIRAIIVPSHESSRRAARIARVFGVNLVTVDLAGEDVFAQMLRLGNIVGGTHL